MGKTTLDALGAIGYVIIFGGQWMIGDGSEWGWWVRIIGSALWAWLGYKLKLWSVVVFSIIGCGIDLRGFVQWQIK